MGFPVLFDTFIERIKVESSSSAVALEDLQIKMSDALSKIQGIDPEVDEAINVAFATLVTACNTCRDWADKVNHFNVLPRCKGDIEEGVNTSKDASDNTFEVSADTIVTDKDAIVALIKECESLKGIIKDNVKSIAAAKVMKQQSEIDLTERDAALTRQYVADGYKLKNETLENFGLTYHGARLRLVESGVWRANK